MVTDKEVVAGGEGNQEHEKINSHVGLHEDTSCEHTVDGADAPEIHLAGCVCAIALIVMQSWRY